MRSRIFTKTNGIRAGLLVGASAMTLWAMPSYAQDAADAPPQTLPQAETDSGEASGESIIVTGSRIPSPTLTSPSPLQTVSADALENTGTTNVLDALVKIPAVGRPGYSRTTSAADTNPGISTVNLRNLGVSRTLVLIDGRRSVAGVPGSSTVDLSMIPSGFVERVDVLTGGASAVYGSDAIAGVVNFIYKKNFEGLRLDAQAGISERGDDENFSVNGTFGSNFADGRGNVMLYAGWQKSGTVEGRNRPINRDSYFSVGNQERVSTATDDNLQAAMDLFTPYYLPSNVGPGGTFNFGGAGSRIIDPDGTFHTYTVEQDGFNATQYGQIASPDTKLTVAARANYDVSDSVNVFFESTYVNFRTDGRREASPMRTDSALGAFGGTNGYYPIQFQVVDPNTGVPVILNNPLVPGPVFAAADNRYDQDSIGSKDMSFLLRTTMFPPGRRTTPTERDNFRIALGADVDISSNWVLHASYQYGLTKQHQEMTGLANLDRLAQALQVIPDVFDFNENGDTTDVVCVDPTARAAGCVPVNVYGLNADGSSKITPEAAAWLATNMIRDSKQTMQVAAVDVGGPLFNLPGGPVQVSVGAEYRKETSSDVFDPLTNAARNGYVQMSNIAGHFDVKEAYGEIEVPLLRDIPFIRALTLRAAGRISDYSTVGSVRAWNVGGEWAPVEDIRLRAVYAHAVRAPNIDELFSPTAASITAIVDPCDGLTLTDTSQTAQNCRLDPSVVANMQANGGTFTLVSSDLGGVGTVSSSDAGLKPEVGKTLTFGAVIHPVSIPALSDITFTADYYDIKLKGAISRVSASTILNHCYDQGIQEFCALIDRRSQPSGAFSMGSVEQIYLGMVNSGGQFSRGLDFTLSYTPQLFGGRAGLSASWTHLIKNGVIPLTGDPYDNNNGEMGNPTDKVNLTLNWENEDFGFTVDNRYIGKQMFDYENYQTRFVLADGSLPPQKYFTMGSKIYTDAQIRFTGMEHAEWYLGVNNLLDIKRPPLYGGPPTGGATGMYDPIGRRFYVGMRLKF